MSGQREPWVDDARRLFQLVQTEGLAVLRRAGPDLLDRVAELAGSLATTLRELDVEDGDPPAQQSTAQQAAHPPAADSPATVRIDVTD